MIATPFPNQPDAYGDRNLALDDASLLTALEAHGAGAWRPAIEAFGARLGRADTLALGDLANRYPPELATHDARGERVDDIAFHPAWDALMQLAKEAGEHASPWSDARPGTHVARAAHVYLHAQVENGTQCPITMTFASMPVLARHATDVPGFDAVWTPRLLAHAHDPRSLPIARKSGALIGMGMTERQGGSDVRTNRTRAEPAGDDGFRLTGHKWFFSVPQSDAHLVLAQEDAGLSCFFVPRFGPDDTRNAIRVNRLKDKLGNRSNASSEVEFDGAWAWRVGDAGRGIVTILEMVRYTRLDCVLGSAGILRAALARAVHYARHRVAFGATLVDQPLMRGVLADLALEVEAATVLALRLAQAFESVEGPDAALARLVTPAAKFWVCKRGPALAAEAMEVLGGNGYVEASGLPRLYRELPVNSIWEGSGNVMALDTLRAARERECVDALLAELDRARGGHPAFDAALERLARIDIARADPAAARTIAQAIAVALEASLLLQHAPATTAQAFCASRLGHAAFGGAVFGTLPSACDTRAIVDRALPA